MGYCLMDNHVHLLLKKNEEIGKSIKRITVSYVQWYNNKYGREVRSKKGFFSFVEKA